MQYSCMAQPIEGYDIVVAGGGPAGIGAGVAAARSGLKTLLVEGTGCLGGTSTSGNLPFMLGTMNGSIPFPQMVRKGLQYRDLPRPREVVGGIFRDMKERMRKAGGGVGPCVLAQTDRYPGLDRLGCHDEFTFDLEIGKRVLDEMAADAGLDVLFYTQALDVKRMGDKIEGVYISNKSGISYVPCRAVVDCTGDADLIARGGFPTYKGDRVTGEMTAMSLITHVENVDSGKLEAYLNAGGDPWFTDACKKAAETYPEDHLEEQTHLIIFPMPQPGVFMINGGCGFSGDGTNGRDMSRIAREGRQRALKLVEKILPFIPGMEHCTVRSTAAYPGVRETRRIEAVRGLTEDDLLEGRHFEDTIALAGRHFDLHRNRGLDGQPFSDRRLGGGFASIPYRALIPLGSENILAAGRCIAAEGQALGPARIMSTCMAVGEAAGTAASLSVKHGVSCKDVDAAELRGVLTAHGAIVD